MEIIDKNNQRQQETLSNMVEDIKDNPNLLIRDEKVDDDTTSEIAITKTTNNTPLSNLFKNIKQKISNFEMDLSQQKYTINSEDTLAEKTLFAFLADLLNSLKHNDKALAVLNELRENEELSKEISLRLIDNQLAENNQLSREILREKGIDLPTLNKNLQIPSIKNYVVNLISNKLDSINNILDKADNKLEALNKIINLDSTKNQFQLTTHDISQIFKDIPSTKEAKEMITETSKSAVKIAIKK